MPTTSALAQQLANGLARMRVDLADAVQARLLAYLDLLVRWNRAYNLTAVRNPVDMVPRHLLDSLAVLPWLHGDTLADLGSGAGLPGIPLAIARPALAVTLIESNGKKGRFLREVVRSLPLANVEVQQARVQDASGSFATLTCRAFANLADILAWSGHLLAADGRLLALKGRPDADELAAVAGSGLVIVATRELDVPGSTGARCLIELVRARPASDGPAMVR